MFVCVVFADPAIRDVEPDRITVLCSVLRRRSTGEHLRTTTTTGSTTVVGRHHDGQRASGVADYNELWHQPVGDSCRYAGRLLRVSTCVWNVITDRCDLRYVCIHGCCTVIITHAPRGGTGKQYVLGLAVGLSVLPRDRNYSIALERLRIKSTLLLLCMFTLSDSAFESTLNSTIVSYRIVL